MSIFIATTETFWENAIYEYKQKSGGSEKQRALYNRRPARDYGYTPHAGRLPLDIEQTHESIRSNFIEEVYEAVEAIDNRDPAMLCEELGDVLLQVVFHARISEEAGEFTFANVVDEVCRKLVVRHPHVFGTSEENEDVVTEVRDGAAVAETADAVIVNWDAIKRSTKEQSTLGEELSGISRALPALMRAAKLAGKAMSAGVYAPSDAVSGAGQADHDSLHDHFGDMLFEIAASAKRHGVDPEQALYDACERFTDKYK